MSATRAVVGGPLRWWLGLTVSGTEHLPPSGPCLIASTHTSHADNLALGVGLGRPVHFLGSATLLDTPVVGPLLTSLGMVPVQRGTGDLTVLTTLQELLDDGRTVVLYPEGSRSRDGRVYRPRSGIARVAASSGVSVLPAAVVGSRDLWPVGRRPRSRRGEVEIRLGPSILAPADTSAARRRFQGELHDTLTALSGATAARSFAPVERDAA